MAGVAGHDDMSRARWELVSAATILLNDPPPPDDAGVAPGAFVPGLPPSGCSRQLSRDDLSVYEDRHSFRA